MPRLLDWTLKGLPAKAEGTDAARIGELGLSLLAEDLMLPAAILKEAALAHNERWMRAFTQQTGVRLCPHGKTTMSPELMHRQLRNGAWGITAATAHHVRVYRRSGIGRVLLANQLIGRSNIAFVVEELARDPDFDFYCLVDSVRGVELLADALAVHPRRAPIQVLLEVGASGGRTGVRTRAQALELVQAIKRCPNALLLRGIEGFEGIFPGTPAGEQDVRELLGLMAAVAVDVDTIDGFAAGPVILSAGGSAFFDLVAASLKQVRLPRPVEVVLRSGCYLTHDHGTYAEHFARIERRSAGAINSGSGLRAALEVWAYVQSVPEPGSLFVALGRRDVSHDAGLPRPVLWFRPGHHDQPVAVPETYHVERLYDQHAHLGVPADCPMIVGDMIGFGISHPCTTFDKWRTLFVVDDAYRVIDCVRTFF